MTDLTPTTERYLAEKAEVIRTIEREAKRTVFKIACEIGEHLSNVRDHLSRNGFGDGTWLAWLEQALPHWSQRTAYNYIGMFKFAQRHGGQLATFANTIDISAIYLLNAPSTPPAAVAEVMERAEAGEKVSRQSVQQTIERHKPEQPPPEPPPSWPDQTRRSVDHAYRTPRPAAPEPAPVMQQPRPEPVHKPGPAQTEPPDEDRIQRHTEHICQAWDSTCQEARDRFMELVGYVPRPHR